MKKIAGHVKTRKRAHFIMRMTNRTIFHGSVSVVKTLTKSMPFWATLFVTRKCNLKCEYCGIVDNKSEDPTFEELCERIDTIKSLGMIGLAIFGAEPSLRDDLSEIINYAHKKHLHITLYSNLSIATEKFIEYSDAGLDDIRFSIDGLEPNHLVEKPATTPYVIGGEEITLKDQIDRLIELKKQKRIKFSLGATMVLTQSNHAEVERVLQFLKERKITLSICIIQPKRPTDKKFVEKLATEENTQSLISLVEQLIDWKKKRTYDLEQSEEYFQAMINYWCGSGDWGCQAGQLSITIDIDGSVHGCTNLTRTKYNMKIDHKELRDKNKLRLFQLAVERRVCVPYCLSSAQFHCSLFFGSKRLFIHQVGSLLSDKIKGVFSL